MRLKNLPRTKKPTQKTIAEATGLAITTVSKALQNDPRISEATRNKVNQTAHELGYTPDRAAQRLRTGKTNVISLVLDPHSELLDFGASIIEGIADVVRGTCYHLTIMQYQLGEDPVIPIKYIVNNNLADGLIFARTEPNDARVSFLRQTAFPFITHGRTNFNDHAWYDYDNEKFANTAVSMLAEKGAKNIGLVPPSSTYTYHRFMISGFINSLKKHNISGNVPPNFDLNDNPNTLYQGIKEWLLSSNSPDALICPGEVSAMTAHAVQMDYGLDIPIVAKQTSSIFNHIRPRPLTIEENIVKAGREITHNLIKIISGEDPKKYQTLAFQ